MRERRAAVAIWCALSGAAAAAGAGALPSPRPAAFDLQAHRGGRGLAPENTLAAFRNALGLGVSTLELDTGVTRDGVVVVSHDPVLNPDLTRDASGRWLESPGPAVVHPTPAGPPKSAGRRPPPPP